ncbi:MAG: MogA/MoaB family molybdenum cofactor biosynthesis protein [Chloroflexi bacterium]|nr:MAG: MogA/MoaB family molybdenum cofactor biosynthesis protein [Chloroflexota bacterium]
MKIGLLTISDRGALGEYEDRSGPLMAKIIADRTHWQETHQSIVPDDFETIVNTLIKWCDEGVNLLLTSGGTGFSPRDITPEATRRVIEREAPGMAEAIRAESLKITKHAMLSRAVTGIREQTLIINMPGNPKAVKENMDVLLPVLPHALELIVGDSGSESSHRSV